MPALLAGGRAEERAFARGARSRSRHVVQRRVRRTSAGGFADTGEESQSADEVGPDRPGTAGAGRAGASWQAKFTGSTMAVAAGSGGGGGAGITLAVTRTSGTQPSRHRRESHRRTANRTSAAIWQALNEAHWDLEAHEARPGAVMQQGVYPYEYARVAAAPVLALGAAGGVPGSVGVVEGDGTIPYKPEAAKVKKENGENWIDRDPELKCYLPGHPARDVHALPVPDRPGDQQGPYGVRVHEHRRAPSTSTRSRARPT